MFLRFFNFGKDCDVKTVKDKSESEIAEPVKCIAAEEKELKGSKSKENLNVSDSDTFENVETVFVHPLQALLLHKPVKRQCFQP